MAHDFLADKMYCGKIRRGDIFLCELPHGEERVVVVLQDDILNEGLPTVVCAEVALSVSGSEIFANELLLKKQEVGLAKDAVCMLHKVITMDRRCMVAKKGELSPIRLREVYAALDVNCGRFRDR